MKILKKIMKFILKLFKWSLILGFILALVGFLAGTIYSAGVIKQTPKITEDYESNRWNYKYVRFNWTNNLF